MEEFKNFDENIKNKLSEEEFPFDENNWEKAAKMIDDSRKPKKRYGWIVIASLVFVGTSVLLFNTFKDDGKSSEKEIVSNEIHQNKNEITSKEDPSLVKTPTSSEETKEEAKTSVNEIKENKSTSESAEVISEKEKTFVSKNDKGSIAPSEIKSETNNASKTKTAKIEKKNKIVKEENTNAIALNNINKAKTTEVKASTEIERKKTEAKKSEEKQIVSAKNNETNKPSNNKTIEQPNVSEKSITTAKNNETINNQTPKQLEVTTNPSVTININAKPDSTVKPIEKIIASAPLDSVRKTDSLKTVVETKTEPKKDETKPEPFYKNLISIEAGASYLLGWQNSGTTEGNGFNPIGGINYSHFFTGKIGVSVGLQYNSISNFINNTTLTKDSVGTLITGGSVSATTHYDFGVQNDIQIINVTKLHYIVAPIKIQYQLKKNIFGVGCNLAAIFNSDNSVETYTDRNNANSQHTISKTTGYYVGAYNTVNVQLSAFYRRKLFKDLSINAEFFYGLSDVKNNTFFKTNATERNIGFKLTLCYDLFKK